MGRPPKAKAPLKRVGKQVEDKATGVTPAQEAFCLELIKTGNASASYQHAYPTSRMKPNSLAVEAHRLQARPNVALRISSLRSEARANSGITLDEHMRALGALRNLASGSKQYSAAITAEMARGKVSGLYDGTSGDDSPMPSRVIIEVVDGRKV